MELGADGLPVLPAKDQAEINAMRRQAQEAEMAALKLLGEDTSGAVQAKPLSMFNRVSSAARAAQRQTAQYLRLRASRDSKVSSAPSTPGSLTPAPLMKAPEPEPMPAKATEPVVEKVPPAKKPSKHVQRSKKAPPAKKAARSGLLEAVEADVRAARNTPAPKPAPSAEPPKPAARAAREPAKAPEPPKYGYESLLSDVSRAYCGYDEAYFHDRPRELASQEKAGQAARAAADAREVVASREAALRSSKDAARAADAALRQLRKPAKTTKETKKDLWLAAPASPTPAEIDKRIDELRQRAEGDLAPDPVLRRARAALHGAVPGDLAGVRVVDDAPVVVQDPLNDPVLRRARAMLSQQPAAAPPPSQNLPAELLDDPVLQRARAMLAAAAAPPPAPVPAESSSSGEDLMARIARLAQTEVEPPLTFEPLK
ncbi:unnamed protein product [Pelagomonas calceolata]|uniref:Uncharacterized protein n=2 Tax=Pelagomonas calceolata TaxID=35677 RepID=A0A8J2SP17_9STRA|nr:unnamed protein product [Pelagomonas calceolata]